MKLPRFTYFIVLAQSSPLTKKYFGNFTSPKPCAEQFDLCFTNPNSERFELDRSLVVVQSSQFAEKYFEDFTNPSPTLTCP